jgi:subtilase family serine protease
MKKLYYSALFIGILVFAIPAFSVDVHWTTSITVTPAVLTTGVPASATATFRVEGAGGIDNLHVIGGVVGGDVMFDRTWAHINDATTRTATFSGTPGDPGTFTIFFQIDPDGTSPDSDRTNNRVEATITVNPGLLPNLVNVYRDPMWTPTVFAAGDVLTIRYRVENRGDAAARGFLVGLRVDGAIIAQNPHPEMAAGAPAVEGSFMWTVVCGAEVATVVDSGNDVSESNEGDNVHTNRRLSECASAPVLPNLTVEKLKIDSGGNIVSEKAALYYRGKVRIRDNSATNVKVRAGIVGGAVLYEEVFPVLEPDELRPIEFKANLKKGIYTLYIEADPDNTIAESNERDNRATSKFQVVGKEGPMIAPAIPKI